MQAIQRAFRWPKQQVVGITCKFKSKARQLKGLLTKDNTKELIRQIFLLIGKAFQCIGMLSATPAFMIESLITRFTRLPKAYTVGSEKKLVDSEELEKQLKKLQKPARTVEKLIISSPAGEFITFTPESLNCLQQLTPDQIILKEGFLPAEMLELLETNTHHYKQMEDSHTYLLSRKIMHLVLPASNRDALQKVEELIAQNERVVNVYLKALSNEDYDYASDHERETYDLLWEALYELRPKTILRILEPQENQQLDTVQAHVSLEDSDKGSQP